MVVGGKFPKLSRKCSEIKNFTYVCRLKTEEMLIFATNYV